MAIFTDTFTQANGDAAGWSNAGTSNTIQVVGNRCQTAVVWTGVAGDVASGIRTLAFAPTTDMQVDFDCFVPSTGAGSAQVMLLNGGDFGGYSVLVDSDAIRLNRLIGGAPTNLATFTAYNGIGTALHLTWTRNTAGVMNVYSNAVLVGSHTDNTDEVDSTCVVTLATTMHATTPAWIDNLVVKDSITGPPLTGSGAITEADDTTAGVGDWTGTGIAGSGAITEADDVVAGVGDWTAAGGGATSIIGYDVEGGGNDSVAPNWDREATVASDRRYVASSGDVVTEFAVYGGGAGGTCEVGVYTYVGGVPVTRVGTANVTISTTTQWHTEPVSIALTGGVEYVVAIHYAVAAGWTAYFDNPGGTSTSIHGGADPLPATWSQTGTSGFITSFYATVTSAAGGDVTGSGAITEADDVASGAGTGGTAGTGAGAISEAADTAAGVGDWTPATVDFPYPASISGRKVLDQNDDVYLVHTLSSWSMASHLTNAEITQALEDVVDNHFNGVTVWMGGTEDRGGTGWDRYTNIAGQNFWAGTPWASALGPAWASVDHLMNEALRLELVVHFSLCAGYDGYGPGVDWETTSDANMQAAGAAIAARYAGYPNLIWHVMFDDTHGPASTRGVKVRKLFDGINATESPPRPVRWAEVNQTATTDGQDWYDPTGASTSTAFSINCIYSYEDDSTVQFEAGWADTTGPTGDCEPPYVDSGHYSGDTRQQFRERNYVVFVEGGCLINFGHECWWPFGAAPLFGSCTDWAGVAADVEMVQARYAWDFCQEHFKDATYAPVETFIVDGEDSADIRAAQGAGDTVAVAYFPNSRDVTVDTTIIAGTGPVRLRWFDPTDATYTLIVAYETQDATRTVEYPPDHGDGSSDYLLVVDETPNAVAVIPTATLHLDAPTPTVAGGGTATATIPPATVQLLPIMVLVEGAEVVVFVPSAVIRLNTVTPTAAGTNTSTRAIPAGTVTVEGETPTAAGSTTTTATIPPATLHLAPVTPSAMVGGVALVPTATLHILALTPTAFGVGETTIDVAAALIRLIGRVPWTGGPEPEGMLTCAVDGPAVRRLVDGPDLVAIDVTGPSTVVITVDGPATTARSLTGPATTSNLVDGPAHSTNAVTGPEVDVDVTGPMIDQGAVTGPGACSAN